MKISVFGLGYVGAVSLACLARDGHEVVGVDVDPNKLDLLRSGRSPIVEEGVQELTASVVKGGRVRVTTDAKEALHDTQLSFVCVGTPSTSKGSQDLSAVVRLAEQLGDALRDKSDFHVIVLRSTVQPGTTEETFLPILEARSDKKGGRDFGLCFQPEFLREGTSIRDYDKPPFTVIGVDCERSAEVARTLLGHLPCEFIVTEIRTAEALKMACNAFHALKITFANEIGRLCQVLGVNSRSVMDLVCRDTRLNISTAYLRPGFAFGGSCLPKDLRALTHLAKMRDVATPMLTNVLGSNRAHIDHAIDMVLATGKRKIGMCGLAFKAGTDDLRESPLVTIAERLIGKGMDLKIFDSQVSLSRLLGANRRYIEEVIPHIGGILTAQAGQVIDHAEVLIVGMLDADILAALQNGVRPQQTVIDLVGMDRSLASEAQYQGVCW
ncbi:MAG TPA: nucleotide sugar dehydrogenase [Steroidobacteraceae bacterium]|nr:nucleotide sugar dehydrogenase [Steroidobacteraceae bacterium]